MAAALYGEFYLHVVTKGDGACGKAVGRDGRQSHDVAVWCHDGTAYAEGIAGAAGGGVDNESVGLIGGEVFAVDVYADTDHAGTVALEHRHFIEGVRIYLGASF